MQLLDGKLVATEIRKQIKEDIQKNAYDIGLAVILVGNDPASEIYVRNKLRACEEVGMRSYLVRLASDSSFEDVADAIAKLNADKNVHGIILQLPLPRHLSESALIDLIDPQKDVDGCTFDQKGRLWTGRDSLVACTPAGVMEILEYYKIPLEGRRAVMIGRSNLVGKPLAQLLLNANCTVTVCHSRTRDLADMTRSADIVCVAIGKAKFLKADMVKEGAVVVDIGMDRDENGKLCGDVDFAIVAPKCSYITPVPGGVGPMTVTMLIKNTLAAYKVQHGIK